MKWKSAGRWPFRAVRLFVIGFFAFLAFRYASTGGFTAASFAAGMALTALVTGLSGPLWKLPRDRS